MWIARALGLLAKVAVCCLAVTGIGTVTIVTLLCNDTITLDQVGQFIGTIRNVAAWLEGGAGLSIIGVLSRYGFPAFLEWRKDAQRRSFETLVSVLEDRLTRT